YRVGAAPAASTSVGSAGRIAFAVGKVSREGEPAADGSRADRPVGLEQGGRPSQAVVPGADLVGENDPSAASGLAGDAVLGGVPGQMPGAGQLLVQVESELVAGCGAPAEAVDAEGAAGPGPVGPAGAVGAERDAGGFHGALVEGLVRPV